MTAEPKAPVQVFVYAVWGNVCETTTRNCWELFGADFLMDRRRLSRAATAFAVKIGAFAGHGSVILLEINPSPSLAMYGEGIPSTGLGKA